MTCTHSARDDSSATGCYYCEQEVLKVKAERETILKIIEDTADSWKDGDVHQMAEVLLARIRART